MTKEVFLHFLSLLFFIFLIFHPWKKNTNENDLHLDIFSEYPDFCITGFFFSTLLFVPLHWIVLDTYGIGCLYKILEKVVNKCPKKEKLDRKIKTKKNKEDMGKSGKGVLIWIRLTYLEPKKEKELEKNFSWEAVHTIFSIFLFYFFFRSRV